MTPSPRTTDAAEPATPDARAHQTADDAHVAADAGQLRPITPLAAGLALTCAALWGGTAVAIHFSQDLYQPLQTAAMRFGLSCLFMLGWCRWQGVSLRIARDEFHPVAVIGVMLFVQIALFHWGLYRTSSSHGSVIIGSHPVMVALFAHFLLSGDYLTAPKVAGLTVASLGLTAVLAGGGSGTWVGDSIVLASSTLLALKTVTTKHILGGMEPNKLILYSNLVGTLLLLAASLAVEPWHWPSPTPAAAAGLLYQGFIVAGFCFAAWTMLLRRHRASELAVFAFFQPLCGLAFGNLFRHETIHLSLLAGSLAVAAGIVLVTRSGR